MRKHHTRQGFLDSSVICDIRDVEGLSMAVAVSEVFFSSVHKFRDAEDRAPRTWRLAPHHVADLSDVATGVEESHAGIACKYLIDSLNAGGRVDIDPDGFINDLDALEKFCQRFGVWAHPAVASWRQRIQRCRRALTRMHEAGKHSQVSILFITYGHPDPSIRELPKRVLDNLGELASLARYTDRVEVHRQEMARKEAVERSARAVGVKSIPTKDTPKHWDAHDIEPIEADESEALESVQRAAAIKLGFKADYGPHLAELVRHRERHESAQRIMTSGDALRDLFAPLEGRDDDESDQHYEQRKENSEVKRDIVTSQIHGQAYRMLEDAGKTYQAAWVQSTV